MTLVLLLVPCEGATPETVVVEEVRGYVAGLGAIKVLSSEWRRQLLRRSVNLRVGGVTKCFELVIVNNTHTGDTVTSAVVWTRRCGN